MTEAAAPDRAATMPARCPTDRAEPPGRSTIRTPISPTTTAIARAAPTFSPSIGTDRMVISIGMANSSA